MVKCLMIPPPVQSIASRLQVSRQSNFTRICRVDCDVSLAARRGWRARRRWKRTGDFCFELLWGRSLQDLLAFAVGFISHLWLTPDSETANAGSRAGLAARLFSPRSIRPVDVRAANAGSVRPGDCRRFGGSEESDNRSESPLARSGFAERFSFDPPSPPNAASQRFDLRHPSTTVLSAGVPPHAPPFHRRWPRGSRRARQPRRCGGGGSCSASRAQAPSEIRTPTCQRIRRAVLLAYARTTP